ncbi:hypothetical protein ABZU46_05315, partial [Micromonospora sp. NPDC005197]
AVVWGSGLPGRGLPGALAARARRARDGATAAQLADAAAELCRAAELDTFGRPRYQLLVVELTGPAGARVLACRGTGANALTGAAVALGALAVAAGDVPPGVHHLAEAVDPAWAVDVLRTSPAVTSLRVEDGPLGSYDLIEEGVA